MRLSLILLCFLVSSFFSPASLFADGASAYPLLTSKHKFSVEGEGGGLISSVPDSDIVHIRRGSKLIKRRPKTHGSTASVLKNIHKKVSAKSAIVIDASSGDVVYAKSPDLPAQPASTIKVLTGLISIDSLRDSEMVPVSRRASRMPRSKIYLRKGQKYPANDLINAVLLASANDASVALAEKIAGSEKVFAKLMTAKAKSFGATNTICKTSNGLTVRGQKSTARDLALIFAKAMENDRFAETMSKRRIKNQNGGMVYSHNKALWRIKGTVGGKTGYTNAARQTYVGKFKRGSTELVVAFLGSETMWSDAKRLVEYGFAKKSEEKRLAAFGQEREWPMVVLGEDGDESTEQALLLSNLRR